MGAKERPERKTDSAIVLSRVDYPQNDNNLRIESFSVYTFLSRLEKVHLNFSSWLIITKLKSDFLRERGR